MATWDLIEQTAHTSTEVVCLGVLLGFLVFFLEVPLGELVAVMDFLLPMVVVAHKGLSMGS